jgi:DNA repair protein RadA/Sms
MQSNHYLLELSMAKKHEQYKCNSCGKIYLSWVGKCTQCGEWNTIEEYVPATTGTNARGVFAQAVPVKSVVKTFSNRIDTGNSEINRMFGGGIVKDSVSIISAPPGAGKSTFATYLCGILSEAGYTVLYASGEESESQIKSRMDRVLGSNISDNLYLLSDPKKQFESVASAIDQINPDFIVLDSIQTFTLDRCAPSRSGSPTQVVEVANELVGICKNEKRPRAALIIGQMIKNDELAGPRQLEHLVDAVYYFEGDPYEELRICTSSKNRFGELETVFFNISEGMRPIDNPSEHLLTQHKHKDVIGSAITIIKEGTLPIAVEVESLIGKSFTPYPSRIGDGLRRDQLSIILNILEQRQNINFYDKNVIVKSGGNIKLHEPSCNLAIAASLISAYSKRPIPEKTVFIGDIGLTGEIKKIQSVEAKIKEAERMGFSTIFVPNQKITGQYKIEIIKINHVLEIFNYICSKDAKKPE